MASLMETYDPTDLEQLTEDKLFPGPIVGDNSEEERRIYLAKKDKALKAKIVALSVLGKNPLDNPSRFNKKEKAKLIATMTEWFEKADEELDAEFNEIVLEEVLNVKNPYETYGVMNNAITLAVPPPKDDVVIAGNSSPVGVIPVGVIPVGVIP